jgi:hypothetical protein
MKNTVCIFFLAIACVFAGCSPIYFPTGTGNPDNNEKPGGESTIYPFEEMGIPKGHLPPPGECKVWFPGRPAGQQPPPQSCSSAILNRPPGAWIVTHETQRFKVVSFLKTEKGTVEQIKYYHTQ